jgi:hypothetical protein
VGIGNINAPRLYQNAPRSVHLASPAPAAARDADPFNPPAPPATPDFTLRIVLDRALPARRAPRFRRAAPGPPLRRAPCRPGQRRQHTKRRRRHHHRSKPHRVPATRTAKADHSKDPPKQVTPRAPARLPRRAPRQPPPDCRRSLLRLRWRRSNARPKPRPRCQHPMIVHLVRPRRRHQRHQAFDKLQPAQLQRRRPITPGALQLNANSTIRQGLHSLLRKRRARDVFPEPQAANTRRRGRVFTGCLQDS